MFNHEEQFVVEVFEVLMGPHLGPITERNGCDGSGLTVDGTYDERDPPLALEITGLHREGQPALASEMPKLEKQLTDVAETNDLGKWVVALKEGVKVKEVLPELEKLIRAGTSIRPGHYGSEELLSLKRRDALSLVKRHQCLEALNIIDVAKLGDTPNHVSCMTVSPGGEISGFSSRLQSALTENASKLRQARPRQTHLAVLVHDFHASRFTSETPPSTLPDDIDRLWVIHTWPGADGRIPVWSLERGASTWSVVPLPPETVSGA